MRELVPFHDPRVLSTIDRTLEELTEAGLVTVIAWINSSLYLAHAQGIQVPTPSP